MRSEVLLQQTTKWHLTLRFCGNLQCSRDPQPSCQKPTPLNPTNPATFPRNIIRTFLMLCTCLRTSGLLYGLESNAVAISNRSCLCRGFAEVGLWGELGRFLLPHFFFCCVPLQRSKHQFSSMEAGVFFLLAYTRFFHPFCLFGVSPQQHPSPQEVFPLCLFDH